MSHDIKNSQTSASHPSRSSCGNGLRRLPGQRFPVPAFRRADRPLLLPLRIRNGGQALHDDVRTATVREPLVGQLLPQEEPPSDASRAAGSELRLTKDELHRRGAPLNHPSQGWPHQATRDFTSLLSNPNLSLCLLTAYLTTGLSFGWPIWDWVSTENSRKFVKACFL